MIAAPVGFHCPTCLAEARQRTPPVRTALGGVVRRQPTRVTRVLIGVNLLLYLLTWARGKQVILDYGMFGAAVAAGEWWRLFTAPFLHAGLWHVALNMYALWILGGLLEPLLGRWRYLAVYLMSALGGAVASYAFSEPGQISVGASGAVFGLLGSTLVTLRKLNRDVSGVLVLLLLNVVLGFVFPNIDWRAHLGGLVVGIVLTTVMLTASRRNRALVASTAVVAVLGGLAFVVSWRTDAILAMFS